MSTQPRFFESPNADAALQMTIDAVARMPDITNLVPEVLRIVAEALESTNCSYHEHRHGELARMRYWYFEGRVLCPDEITNIADEQFALLRQLAVGFTVPDFHLGCHFRRRTRASIVDHTRTDTPSFLHHFCIEHRWEMELNVPLVVAGEADGALVIFRNADRPFTVSEVHLAEALGHQLAFAIEVSRLTRLSQHTKIVQQRELSSRQRSEELSLRRQLLAHTIDSLVDEMDFLQFIGRLLAIVSIQLDAPVIEYWTHDGGCMARLVQTYRNGLHYRGSDRVDDVRIRGIKIPTAIAGGPLTEAREVGITDMLHNFIFREYMESVGVPIREMCRDWGIQTLVVVPLIRSGRSFGALCLLLRPGRELQRAEINLATSLAQQVSLAARMLELAELSKQTAVSRERECAAQGRAAELTRANNIMSAALEQLSEERDLNTYPRTVLRAAMTQIGAKDGAIFVFNQETNTILATDVLIDPPADADYLAVLNQPIPTSQLPDWEVMTDRKAPTVINLKRDGHMIVAGAAEWHLSRGNRSIINAPIFVGKRPYGFLALALPQSAEHISEIDVGLINALTQHVGLAVQLTRLVDESNQGALAKERQIDAESRAAELAQANEVLRSTLDQLSEEGDLLSFPRTILKEAIHQTGARDGLILSYQQPSGLLSPLYYLRAEEPDAEPPSEFGQALSARGSAEWEKWARVQSPIMTDVATDSVLLPPGPIGWHKSRGSLGLIAVPMRIGGTLFGYFGVVLPHSAANVSKISVGLLHALAQQATLAIQLTQLAEVSKKTAISLERQQVIVQERAHMAREVHDKLAQGYAAILMQQKALRRSIAGNGELMTPHLDIIERLAKDNLGEARRIMNELKVDGFDEGSLDRALQNSVDQTQGNDFAVQLSVEGELPTVPRYVENELGRVIAEALLNARRHSRARTATVAVRRTPERLTIAIKDEGVGFDLRSGGPSFGIPSMHERALRAGASLAIVSALGQGTEVTLTLSRTAT